MIRLRRKHRLPVTPDQAADRVAKSAEDLGQAREAHAHQVRARQAEAPTVRALNQALENNSLWAILRDSVMHADDPA